MVGTLRLFALRSLTASPFEIRNFAVSFVQQPDEIQIGRVIAAGQIGGVFLQLLLTLYGWGPRYLFCFERGGYKLRLVFYARPLLVVGV